jgi:glycine dehydrogenase subunit 1
VAASGRQQVEMSDGVHRNWQEVVRTFAAGTGHDIVSVPLRDGVTDWSNVREAGAIVVQYPNRLGVLDDIAAAARASKETGTMLVVAFDPIAAAILKSPGEWGADVAVGEGQPFGTPMSFGGPYLGLFAAKLEHVRRIPGRLVGETADPGGRRAFTTTLRTREQDIRREKASSNVCTNQTLIAVTAMIQMGWMGKEGLVDVATQCARGTRYAREALLAIDGVTPLVGAPVLREFAVATPVAPDVLVERMADEGFLAGTPTDDGQGNDGLLIAVTEKRTRAEVDAFVAAFEKVVR